MADTISLDDLLGSRLLDVPDYQRGYAWGGQQLAEFWEDLELIEPGGRHYTGTVVLNTRQDKREDEDRSVPLSVFDVVDGQQRLTTCVILLKEFFDALGELGDEDTPANRRRLLTARIGGVLRPKLQVGPDLRDYWQQLILVSKPTVEGPMLAAQRRMSEAQSFFQKKIEDARANLDAPGYKAWLRSVVGKVMGSLQFTLYVAGDEAEVGVIFETLNQRGKPLTELEKTKNYLLYLASRLPGEQLDHLSQAINAAWKTVFTNLGHLSPDHEDQFLRAHWLATQDPSQRDWARVNSVKARFHRRLYTNDKERLFSEVGAYVASLREASAAYRDVVSDSGPNAFAPYGTLAPAIRSASRNLRNADVVQIFAPLLIAARLRFPDEGAPYLKLVEQCERYSVRVFLIMERRANAGQARLYTLAHNLHANGDADAAFAGLAERIAYFASDAELKADLENVRRNWYAKRGHKYFLYQYEIHRLGGKPPSLSFDHFTKGEFKASSTEHILPQTPDGQACWDDHFSEDERAYLTHALGNLVLTYDNSVYSNFCFVRKRDGAPGSGPDAACYRHSPLKQEQELANYEAWTPGSIAHRQAMLAAWAMQRWAVPDAPHGPMVGEADLDEDEEPGGQSAEGADVLVDAN